MRTPVLADQDPHDLIQPLLPPYRPYLQMQSHWGLEILHMTFGEQSVQEENPGVSLEQSHCDVLR